MSFSNDVRSELARIIPDKLCCCRAELSALLMMNGRIVAGRENLKLKVKVENATTARKVFILIKKTYQLPASVRMEPRKRFKKTRVYEVYTDVPKQGSQVLTDAQLKAGEKPFQQQLNHQVNWDIVGKNCCKRAFLRGVFLSRGFVNRPEGSYHLEIVSHELSVARDIQKLMACFGLEARIVERKNHLVIYLKESEKIVDFLRVVGASSALLDFENIRILKSMRNDINRQVNCETANLAKTVDASVRQIGLIKELVQIRGWEGIPSNLREMARLRVDYPDSTLKELGEMLSPPLSKSGVAYRMRRLEQYARENLPE